MLLAVLYLLTYGICEGFRPRYIPKRYYDTFRGTPISDKVYKQLVKNNQSFWCAIEVEKCDSYEGRRLDGTCNNLKNPTRGGTHTPFYRVLSAKFDGVDQPRKSASGEDLPLPRYLRTSLLAEGRVPDQVFTQLFTHFMVFMLADVAAPHDTANFILWKPYCCTAKGARDRDCTPNKVPSDDPVFRYTDIRCLNMTRPISFQTFGCVPYNTISERINTATPLFDASIVYGSIKTTSLQKGRLFKHGLLKYELLNKREWPPAAKPGVPTLCFLNEKPYETRCHDTPDDGMNVLLGTNLCGIWFWRYHNYIARKLRIMNPCWNDERLFYTARDINIAVITQIYYYELLPDFLGRENLLRDNVISSSHYHRDMYDEAVMPQVSLEYSYALRWIHTIQEGRAKMYHPTGHYLKQIPVVNLTLKTGFLSVDNNIAYLTQGSFRQACGKVDKIVDPDLTGNAVPVLQRAVDILTNDLAKSRYFGLPPYVKYREFCSGLPINSFDDLADIISPENLETLRELYQDVNDIDLMAGIWVEKVMEGSFAPPTFYCLVADQLIRSMISDRHWYERLDRPNAFTDEQLMAIRQSTIAGVLCAVGDSVINIQPKAFLRASRFNRVQKCAGIELLDLSPWKDERC